MLKYSMNLATFTELSLSESEASSNFKIYLHIEWIVTFYDLPS